MPAELLITESKGINMHNLAIYFSCSVRKKEIDMLVSKMKQYDLKVIVIDLPDDYCLHEMGDVIALTDDASFAGECSNRGIPYLFLLYEKNKQESLPSGTYCVENLVDVSYDYLDKVYRRAKGLPWNILTTDRLQIREITPEDVPRLYELYEEESITRYMEPLFPDQQQEIDYTKDYIKNVYHFYGYGMWLIILKESGEIIGRAGLEYKEGFEGLELGFMLGKDYQHKGYAYESCKAILDYACEELEQTSFRAIVHRNNEPSRHLCEKLGFQKKESTEETQYLEYRMNRAL